MTSRDHIRAVMAARRAEPKERWMTADRGSPVIF